MLCLRYQASCMRYVCAIEFNCSLIQALPGPAASCDTFIILQIFMRFGLPKVLTSDQGSEFNNSLDTMLMEMPGIDH